MSSGFQLFDIILFAMIAAFLVLRLRSVLGRRTGNERRPTDALGVPARESDANVIALPPRAPEAEVEDIAPPKDVSPADAGAGITQIRVADPTFDPDGFVEGARSAFEMIVGAYARGDSDALRPLLNDTVFTQFAGAIRERETQKQTLETTVVAIRGAEIAEAHMEGRTAFVTVKFASDQINVVRDAAGTVVEGDPGRTTEVVDLWTFARNTRSRDPNWLLVATGAPQH
ncbi:MAG: Tim44 domain-containing protein [Alphaproteobacteria bacterium]|nr:Tim44 domain-containing protein [Alphaproteobacteria bacterium]